MIAIEAAMTFRQLFWWTFDSKRVLLLSYSYKLAIAESESGDCPAKPAHVLGHSRQWQGQRWKYE